MLTSVKVAAWKRNMFRTFIAMFVVAASIILRNVFVYVGAIVGEHRTIPILVQYSDMHVVLQVQSAVDLSSSSVRVSSTSSCVGETCQGRSISRTAPSSSLECSQVLLVSVFLYTKQLPESSPFCAISHSTMKRH